MARTPSYNVVQSSFAKGIGEIHLASWQDFVAYIHETVNSVPDFVWRGQRVERWPLQPGLERELDALKIDLGSEQADILRFQHLSRFRLSARGRLDPRDLEERVDLAGETSVEPHSTNGEVPLGPSLVEREENNWWAIGQHYGLKTPLLDWSTSPFVAAFFAFAEPSSGEAGGRAIYGLHKTLVSQKSDEIREMGNHVGRPPVVDFIEPLYKDNPRLVSQGGLFTRSPAAQDVREWVEARYGEEDEGVWLLKLVLPDEHRNYVLRALNRMNINHQSLFPDLYGASEFVNVKLVIEDY